MNAAGFLNSRRLLRLRLTRRLSEHMPNLTGQRPILSLRLRFHEFPKLAIKGHAHLLFCHTRFSPFD
jgi:hypothetical protein